MIDFKRRELKVILLFLVIYVGSITIQTETLSNVTSTVLTGYCAFLLFNVSQLSNEGRWSWRLLGLMALSWMFADGLWFIFADLLKQNPEENTLFTYIYFVPNTMLVFACAHYFFKRLSSWNKAQLSLDGFVISVLSIFVFYHIFYEPFKGTTLNVTQSIDVLYSFGSNVLAVTIGTLLYISNRKRRMTSGLKLLVTAIVVYSISDLVYVYSIFTDSYAPNGLIDFNYMLAFTIFSIAAIGEYSHAAIQPFVIATTPENIGVLRKAFWLIGIPFVFYLFERVSLTEMLYACIFILVYILMSAYVQIGVKNEYLFKHEQHLKEELEILVEERTEALVKANEALNTLNNLDVLTGLYNRRFFIEAVDNEIDSSSEKFAVFFMDLDRFKIVNDTHGHSLGDFVLIEVSKRLTETFGETCIISRIGGDEFVMLLKAYTTNDTLTGICKQIHRVMKPAILVENYAFNIGISVGIARFPEDSTSRDSLLKFADLAMYHAKEKFFGERCALYTSSLSEKMTRKHEIELWLNRVDYNQEFELFYQPQWNLNQESIIGVEALLRWKRPNGEFISPGEFIPLAEETGIIIPISDWVTMTAIKQISEWNNKYNRQLVMGINISPKLIDSTHFVINFEQLLLKNQVNPKWIDLEITESSAMHKGVAMEEVLTGLSALGVSISIDDFGTGYSSMSYIKRFDVDRLKIAKELIDQITTDHNDFLIVKAIIMMAKGMDMKTIAEGVEYPEQLEVLKSLECDEIQGYVYSRPIPASEFEKKYLVT